MITKTRRTLFIPKYVLLIVAILLLNTIAYFLLNKARQNDKIEFQQKVEQVFDGKKSVTYFKFNPPYGVYKLFPITPALLSTNNEPIGTFSPNSRAFFIHTISKIDSETYESLTTFSDDLEILQKNTSFDENDNSEIHEIYSNALHYLLRDLDDANSIVKERPTEELEGFWGSSESRYYRIKMDDILRCPTCKYKVGNSEYYVYYSYPFKYRISIVQTNSFRNQIFLTSLIITSVLILAYIMFSYFNKIKLA